MSVCWLIGRSVINSYKESFYHYYLSTCYVDKDNKAMAAKIASENEERKKKEEEMQRRLKEAQEVC